jgi:hypothetical protein
LATCICTVSLPIHSSLNYQLMRIIFKLPHQGSQRLGHRFDLSQLVPWFTSVWIKVYVFHSPNLLMVIGDSSVV